MNGKFVETNKMKVSDVGIIMDAIKNISDPIYQERIWVRHEDPNIVDSYDDTTMYFLEDAEAILEDPSDVIISKKQYDLLKKLYVMVDEYDDTLPYPTFQNYDKKIIDNPKWHEIREFAKIVYKELIRDPKS